MLRFSKKQMESAERAYAEGRWRKLRQHYGATLAGWIVCSVDEAERWFDHAGRQLSHLPQLKDAEIIALVELARIQGGGSVDSPAYRRCCETLHWPMRALWLRGQLSMAIPDSPFLNEAAPK